MEGENPSPAKFALHKPQYLVLLDTEHWFPLFQKNEYNTLIFNAQLILSIRNPINQEYTNFTTPQNEVSTDWIKNVQTSLLAEEVAGGLIIFCYAKYLDSKPLYSVYNCEFGTQDDSKKV
nr:unnamed protein product [Callosobruchus chinensis]